ncbi:MAG: CDP-alcohol phosphatidyltransferase family protein [Planctomycetota bacterium]
MLDTTLRKLVNPALNPIATMLVKTGISANSITIIGFLIGVVGWIALALNLYYLALGIIVINRIFDGLDGLMAQKTTKTEIGGYLDIVLDFIFYSGVPFFFVIGKPEVGLPASFLIFSFIGTGSSFLAYSVIAAKHNIKNEKYKSKAIYYLGGLTEGTETIAFFLFICIKPDKFTEAAWIFGGLCWITTFTRIYTAYINFKNLKTI